ncbi:MAG: uracil-DNA glycosylase [Ruminiclostridium sp.]|nr:uracil-DNA glycosylase [Ruminiclostridium sp.]
MVNIGNDWDELLKEEFRKEYYKNLRKFLVGEYNGHNVFPPADSIYNALKLTSYKDTKVVLLGQDPYHGAGQAHGLCFSVKEGVTPPPSLKNIYKEIYSDLGIARDMNSGDLTGLARQGVLLLNTSLTVREGMAGSHRGKGWEILTDRIISLLNEKQTPVAFILWGGNAKAKAPLITNKIHGVFTAAHPSPLSAYNGFFGCRHFSKINNFLTENKMAPIDWSK